MSQDNKIMRFIRLADDMGMNQGDIHWGNRGVVWHRFNAGSYSRLPPAIQNALSEQTRMFRKNYEQYAINPKTGKPFTDFSGMLFTIYAEDRSITPDVDKRVPPNLRAAADLVKNFEVKLPPMSEKQEKAIGGPQWISHYAYAWRSEFPNEIQYDESKAMPRSVLQLTNEIHKKYEHGPLVIRNTDNGLGLFIATNLNNLVPVYIGQSAAGLTKYFAGNLAPNQSNVYMPEGPHGSVYPARKPKSINARDDQPQYTENLQRFVILSDGSIGADFDGEFIPFNESQIKSIVPRLNTLWYIRPAKDIPGITTDMGPWRMSERLQKMLSHPTAPNGFEALRELRQWLEQIRPGLHTPAEGFKVITVGPIFSNALALPEGQTIGNVNFVTNLTKSNPETLDTGTVSMVRREVQWVVIANEYSEARMAAAGQGLRPSARAQGESERSPAYKNPAEAIMYVKAKYLSNSPNGDSILNELSRSVQYADKALQSALGDEGTPAVMPGQQQTRPQIAEPSTVNQAIPSAPQTNQTPNPIAPKEKPRIRLDPSKYKQPNTASVKHWLNKYIND